MNGPLTITIIAVTALSSIHGFGHPAYVERFIFNPEAILRGRQGWRLVTHGFLHADWFHLFFNMYSLYSFGSILEAIYGPVALLAIYFGAIIGGGLLSLFIHRHHVYRAYGASGGVCGVIFASIFLTGSGVQIMFIPFAIPGWAYAIFFLLASFYGMKKGRDNVGHDAHLGGAIIGLGVATLMYPGIVMAQPVLLACVVGLSIILLIYLVKNPLFLPLNAFSGTSPAGREQRRPLLTAEQEARRVNELLDKVSHSGMGSLSKAEHEFLLEASRRGQRGGGTPET